ncbi:hypothetical protein B0H14DRAFT_2345446 [Mycena olivaceomarginata]|nr:hypothetical protein B0H14DRAFT_2345446 [Mycena olivaceomarginata]
MGPVTIPLVLQNTQHGIKGHVIIYPQQPSKLAAILPPAIEDIISPVCVLFVGSSPPTPEWLRDHTQLLAVSATRVRKALQWLKEHNPQYRDITINESCLHFLEENPVLPFNIEHISNNVANETITSRYDAVQSPDPSTNLSTTIPFQNIVITDIDCHPSAKELLPERRVNLRDGGALVLLD